jgi:hypothetical protein
MSEQVRPPGNGNGNGNGNGKGGDHNGGGGSIVEYSGPPDPLSQKNTDRPEGQ